MSDASKEKGRNIVLDDRGEMNEDWPEYASVSVNFLRQPRVQNENGRFVIYATNGKATYEEVPRVRDDPADNVRMKLVDVDPTFRANGGPLRDDQVSPNAASPTIAPLETESNQAENVFGGGVDLEAQADAVMRGAVTGGGVAGRNMTTATADIVAGDRPATHEAGGTLSGGQQANGGGTAEAFDDAVQNRDGIADPEEHKRREAPADQESTEDTTSGGEASEPAGDADTVDGGQGDDTTSGGADSVSGAEQGSDATATTAEDAQRQPATAQPDEPDAASSGDQSEYTGRRYEVQHRGRGSYSILDEDGKEVHEGLNKEAADAFKVLSYKDRADFVAGLQSKDTPEDAA